MWVLPTDPHRRSFPGDGPEKSTGAIPDARENHQTASAGLAEQVGYRLRKRSVHPDARGRITLGDAVGDAEYRVLVNDAGQILLDPVVTLAVAASEAWIRQDDGVRASMDRALEQAARGEFHDLGSFAEYLELETDEEA